MMGLVWGALCLLPAWADSSADRFAGTIQKYRETAAAVRESLARLTAELNQIPVFSKLDGPLMAAHLEAVAQTWADAAAAFEKGEATAGTNLALRAQQLAGQRDRWQERIRWRSRQAQQNEYMPASAEVFTTWAKDRIEPDTRELAALMEAKKRRSEAYGRLAEASTATADARTLHQLQDEMFALDIEVGVAEMRLPWAHEDWMFRKFLATDPMVTSPELAAAQQRLAGWRRQREEAYQQSRRQHYALERLDRESKTLLAARENAYRSAKAAREGKAASRTEETKPGHQSEAGALTVTNPGAMPARPAVVDPPLPPPWGRADIGPVKEPGSSVEDKGVFTVRGAGWGLWGAADSCHLVFQPLAGDVDAMARLGELPTDENPFVAGLTVREGSETNSTQASVMMFPDGKVLMSCRPADGTAESALSPANKPYQWVRLIRTGDRFSGFCSSDGVAWVLVGTVRVKMSASAQVGLACAATLNQALVETRFDHVKIAAQTAGPAEGLGLVDGSLLAGQATSLDEQTVKYVDAAGAERSLPAQAVACLFTRALPADVRQQLAERGEGVSFVSGDELEGSVREVRNGKVTVVSVLLGQQTPTLSKVLAVRLRPVKASGACSVSTRDGSIYRCKAVTVGNDVVVAEGGIAGTVSLKATEVVEMNRPGR